MKPGFYWVQRSKDYPVWDIEYWDSRLSLWTGVHIDRTGLHPYKVGPLITPPED